MDYLRGMKLNLRFILLFLALFWEGKINLASQLPTLATRRLHKTGVYKLKEYRVIEEDRSVYLKEVETKGELSFSFPVSITDLHSGAYLWFKDLIEKGLLPRGLKLVYFDPHPDFIPQIFSPPYLPDPATWVNGMFAGELIKNAYQVLPPWISESQFRIFYPLLFKEKPYPFEVIFNLKDLPLEENSGSVIVSFDFDWFSCHVEPFYYKPKSTVEIEKMIDEVISIFSQKKLKIAALNLSLSPNFTFVEDISKIREILLKKFQSLYGK